MTGTSIDPTTPRKPLRLWPGIVAVAVQWAVRFVVPVIVPAAAGIAIIGGAAGGLVVLLWWLFFSRAPWLERVGAVVLMIASVLAMYPVAHESISGGMMGMLLPIFSIPLLSLALVASVSAGRHLSNARRRMTMAAAIVMACGTMTLVRTAGVTGDGASDMHWRWTQTPEDRLLARDTDESLDAAVVAPRDNALDAARDKSDADREKALDATRDRSIAPDRDKSFDVVRDKPLDSARDKSLDAASNEPLDAARSDAPRSADPAGAKANADWPGFRGSARDGAVRGVRIETDWSRNPPVELWRRQIGPGWSSFAVRGDLVYTQEQRGNDEVVSSYRLSSGEPVWRHADAVRFWESNAGAGPRGTPTVRDGRVYSLGATGIVSALDATNGAVVWSRNAATDTRREVPEWGFSSSPLVTDDLVVVAVAGQLVAYDVRTGHPRWFSSPEGGGYSSPHLMTIDGVPQILLLRGRRASSFAPADGKVLWEDSWQPAVSIVQPAMTAEGNILIAAGDAMGGIGIRRIAVSHGSAGWAVEERWTSRGLKPYFNDLVVHKGHAFGFDGSILACIDLNDGQRKWKGGRYGHGQLLLLPDQDVLLVISEEGELALVRAAADRFTELARMPALEGKTWNHPVLVRDVLLVRNGEEMVAYRLSPAAR